MEHPIAKMIVEVAKTQEEEVGDGTTTAVILAGELLREAEALLEQNVHPTVIIEGFNHALKIALDALRRGAKRVRLQDERLLQRIALTAMTGKGVGESREHLARIVVQAVRHVAQDERIDLDAVKLDVKPGASIEESRLVEGIVLDKERVHPEMPLQVEDARIALLDTALEVRMTELDAKLQLSSPDQFEAFLAMEERMIQRQVDAIVKAGANVVFCQKGIDDLAQYYLAQHGVYAVRRVVKSDLERLAKATGGRIVTSVEELKVEDLGRAERVRQEKVGDEYYTFVEGCQDPRAVSLLLRGSTEHVAEEVKRAVEDALGVLAAALREGAALPGAAAAEMLVARAVRAEAEKAEGKEQLILEAFARALEIIPKTLAENAGLDPIDILARLRKAHADGKQRMGVNVFEGGLVDAWREGIVEPLAVKEHALRAAVEVGSMILRIDDIFAARKAKPEEQEEKA